MQRSEHVIERTNHKKRRQDAGVSQLVEVDPLVAEGQDSKDISWSREGGRGGMSSTLMPLKTLNATFTETNRRDKRQHAAIAQCDRLGKSTVVFEVERGAGR
jgi:hypothetical protein